MEIQPYVYRLIDLVDPSPGGDSARVGSLELGTPNLPFLTVEHCRTGAMCVLDFCLARLPQLTLTEACLEHLRFLGRRPEKTSTLEQAVQWHNTAHCYVNSNHFSHLFVRLALLLQVGRCIQSTLALWSWLHK